MKKLLAIAVLFLTTTLYSQSVVDRWVTIDDKTGKKKSIVELYKEDGKLYGKIVYLFPREGRGPNPVCDKCEDDRKDQPLEGLQIVRDLEWNGKEWKGGTIVDPETGTVYDVKMWLNKDNSEKLNVRGYVSVFYRTQQWLRVPKKNKN